MKGIRRFLDRIPRQLRFAVDLALALALLLAVYVARGCPSLGYMTEFRRAEKAWMVGPSKPLGWVALLDSWPRMGYERVILADDGDSILFFGYDTDAARSSSLEGALVRREKTDGLLLTPLPSNMPMLSQLAKALPLFLFVDDPAAVRATLILPMTETETETLTATRGVLSGETAAGSAAVTEFFCFQLPITAKNRDIAEELMYCGSRSADLGGTHPATILLYDEADRLIAQRDYVIQARTHG